MDRREFLAMVGTMAGGITLWPNQVFADHLQQLQPKGERPAPPRSAGIPKADIYPVNLVWPIGSWPELEALRPQWDDAFPPMRLTMPAGVFAVYETHPYVRVDDAVTGRMFGLIRKEQRDGQWVYGIGDPSAWNREGLREDVLIGREMAPDVLLEASLKRLGGSGSWSINRSFTQHPDGTREPMPVYDGYENHWNVPSLNVQNPA